MMLKYRFIGAAVVALLAAALSADVSFGRGRGGGGGYSGGRAGSYSSATRSTGSFNSAGTSFNRSGLNSASRSKFSAANTGAYGNRYAGYYGGYGGWGGYGGYGRGWGWGWGGYWPWFGAGWGWGWGYPGSYGYYYPGNDSYYYSYAPTDYTAPGTEGGAETAPQQAPAIPTPPPTSSSMTSTADDQQVANEGLEDYSAGREAFLQGDYRTALRDAGHAAVDAPRNPKVHELLSLGLFAEANYPAAASEAHAAMALGPIAEWKDLYSYYNNADKYTTQLRALEKASAANPKSAAEHFLLGYHYLMTGARKNAQMELAEAAKLTPNDKLAAHFLKQLESNSPLTPPQMAAQPNGQAR